ncbi:MAG: ferritin family protein [Polyangiaceae bacterium]
MPRFNPREVLQFAVAIEQNGEKFYREAGPRLEDARARELFLRLAREEVGHEQLFSRLLAKMEDLELDVRHSDDYLAYLRAYVDNVAFRHEAARAELEKVMDRESAIRFAMQREQDSVQFYTELRELVPEAERGAIDEIIAEERSHFLSLSKLLEAS